MPSILRIMTWGTPNAVVEKPMPQPLQWNSGSVCRYTSRSVTPMCMANVVAFTHSERWVCTTPFGLEVVPEV